MAARRFVRALGSPVAVIGMLVLAFSVIGAALNSTNAPGDMTVELFDPDNQSLGVFPVHLRATLLSRFGGTFSNTEGAFFISGIGKIASVLITSKGDEDFGDSKQNWVLDNVMFDAASQP